MSEGLGAPHLRGRPASSSARCAYRAQVSPYINSSDNAIHGGISDREHGVMIRMWHERGRWCQRIGSEFQMGGCCWQVARRSGGLARERLGGLCGEGGSAGVLRRNHSRTRCLAAALVCVGGNCTSATCSTAQRPMARGNRSLVW
jgi:hypothetical protein